jgi:hypothetical protein
MCLNTNSNNNLVLFCGYSSNWPTYQINYNNVFNFLYNFQEPFTLSGAITGTVTSINNSIFDSTNKRTYICGNFNITISPTSNALNIAYLDGTNWKKLGTTASLTFSGVSTIYCMVFAPSSTSTIYIGGSFTSVSDNNDNTSAANFAIINVSGTNYTVTPAASASTPPGSKQINSLAFVGTTLYAGGTDINNKVYFYKYVPATNTWTNLLSAIVDGSINIIHKMIDKPNPNTRLVIGGNFLSLGTATNCNNVVIYDTTSVTPWTYVGIAGGTYGVTGIGTTNKPYNFPVVFTINSYFTTNVTYIYIGGYFLNAGGAKCNSITIYNYSSPAWINFFPTLSTATTNPGVLYNNLVNLPQGTNPDSTDPGVVNSIIFIDVDSANALISGQFYFFNPTPRGLNPAYVYNVFKKLSNPVVTEKYGLYNTKTF